MPRKNGVEVIHALRSFIDDQQTDELRIDKPQFVIVTAYASTVFRGYVKSHGIDHCYEKPLSIE